MTPADAAYALARTLAGQEMNGEADTVPEPFRAMVARLADVPVDDALTGPARQEALAAARWPVWQDMLAARPDRDELVEAVADANPDRPPPEADPEADEAADGWEPIRPGRAVPFRYPAHSGPRPGQSRRQVDRLPGRLPRRGDPGRRLGDHRPIRHPAHQGRLRRLGVALRGPRGEPVQRQVPSALRCPGSAVVHRGMSLRSLAR